ncbi:hypothetical protein [Telmatospirillum siberiense]|nr:hypothetical protein [Telmatospirillum siberiense]
MGQVEELEARRAKLEARLAEVKRRQKAVEQAAVARTASADRKVDARRKIVLGGVLLALLRSNPAALDYMRRALPPLAAERDRPLLTTVLDGLGAPVSGQNGDRAVV